MKEYFILSVWRVLLRENEQSCKKLLLIELFRCWEIREQGPGPQKSERISRKQQQQQQKPVMRERELSSTVLQQVQSVRDPSI